MDPYVYPATDVLRNLRDIRDPERFTQFEADATSARIDELSNSPLAGKFDAAHLQAIHRHIFQDVFSWAGEFRTVNIGKSGTLFALPQHISSILNHTFDQLKAEQHLNGLSISAFCDRAAYYLGEINAIHPFREGNGRTQREFIRELAAHSGWYLAWSTVTREQMIDASRKSFRRDISGLEQLLRSTMVNERNQNRVNIS